eukprot:CAMPEP_0204850590 /NCGR_PEP_ID=MMETSP1347-20130617/8439_1 /ASSEMBLY_ACC=CAM_ASM_000690 /TAXON_ID=215587 /ORGANISM="Aplanochytrium stocchinoi, Strain GSBS06" /LENGTH=231 /DNA_ID=CAMNT_0051993673 /DNA_START=303 /DNA_END=998 /DNA_ORIENTATION=-
MNLARIPARHPFAFGVGFTVVKTAAADMVVQSFVEGKALEAIDYRRTAIFSSFGLVYLGAWQYFLYNKIMPRLCPNAPAFISKSFREKLADGPGKRDLAKQLFLENGINNPVLYFPTFYTLKEMMESNDPDVTRAFPIGLAKYSDNFWEDFTSIMRVWMPVQLFNFSFSPMWFRVPLVAIVSFGFTCYVSVVRGKPAEEADQLVEAKDEDKTNRIETLGSMRQSLKKKAMM